MLTRSENCPRRDACVQNGKGLIHMKDLTDKKGLYDHGRLFAHVTVDPGCSIGDHPHDHETEFYYIIKGEAVFNDNGAEVTVRPGTSAPPATARSTAWRTGAPSPWSSSP